MTIENLQELIPDSHVLTLEDTPQLQNFDDGILLFMGAGDIQKFQNAYENSK